ncbi:MAG: hypothetical protein K8E66_00575 [Phycisphaerales bacterium]|nr:hypothetical protein [Phycisphaerales bacterium]
MVGLLMPTLGTSRRRAAQVVCAVELRDMVAAVTTYASMEQDAVPFPYLSTDTPGVWLTMNGQTEVTPRYFSTAADFWVYPILDAYGGTFISESLLCPEDQVSEEAAEWASDETGVPPERIGLPLVRGLSRAFYFTPSSLRSDLLEVRAGDCMVATLDDVFFPSQKALVVESLPFHMSGFIGPGISAQFRPCQLNVAATDGSVDFRSQADAFPGVLVEPLPPPSWWQDTPEAWRDDRVELSAFQFTRDGVHGRDW